MDLHLSAAEATAEEREAVDAVLGVPTSGWDGGIREAARDGHIAHGGDALRASRHRLLPALEAVQARMGWISEGAFTYVCTRLGVPPAEAYGVATFYALLSMEPRPPRVLHVCDDVVCRTRGAKAVIDTLGEPYHAPNGDHTTVNGSDTTWLRSPCLGLCDQAPAAFLQIAGREPKSYLFGDVSAADAQAILKGNDTAVHRPHPRIPQQGSSELRLLARVGVVDPTHLDAYRAAGGFEALRRAHEIGPEAVIREVTDSKLMGRGGAAFPTGKKWEAVAKQGVHPHYLICNADESEPGTFKDRVLMEEDPFAIIEAMAIAAFATGCEQGYVYIRGEYPLASARLKNAIAQATAHGLLGDLNLEVREGGGAYICGEETAIFNSIEGQRGEPRNKPPFPVESGVFKKPTLINNVETLANIPRIILEGGPAFAAIGAGGQSTGTKLFCLSGAVGKPGVYEVPFGVTLGQMLSLAGGAKGKLQAVLLGGAAGLFVRPDELDMPLTFEGVRAAKATLGSGVIAAFDDTVDMTDILLRIAAFFRDESCGQCVPCRVGTVRQEEALHRIAHRCTRGSVTDEIALLDEIGLGMKDASICGLGQTAYSAVESAIKRLKLYE
ncbi:MAG TPA: NAD(P)H-dependent oxidoreductase subunit E [Gemmatimonadaceae bacterium]|nr:NAD(P)H-dependent oxidoreductase subunit E [Gemmatimonadaceae bacterium]